jgi:hypothetical protein
MEVAAHAHGLDPWVATLLAMTVHSVRPRAGVDLAIAWRDR